MAGPIRSSFVNMAKNAAAGAAGAGQGAGGLLDMQDSQHHHGIEQ